MQKGSKMNTSTTICIGATTSVAAVGVTALGVGMTVGGAVSVGSTLGLGMGLIFAGGIITAVGVLLATAGSGIICAKIYENCSPETRESIDAMIKIAEIFFGVLAVVSMVGDCLRLCR